MDLTNGLSGPRSGLDGPHPLDGERDRLLRALVAQHDGCWIWPGRRRRGSVARNRERDGLAHEGEREGLRWALVVQRGGR